MITSRRQKTRRNSNAQIRSSGKFGVGLKDALATFHRHGINVVIHSKHNTFRTEEAPKHGFEDISTLHVDVQPPKQSL